MSNGVRYTPTFALPSEYEQAAAEARRRRRMAEMLAQQAYQPQDVGVAPIPKAAPLVQGLQAFLSERQARKAEEAEEKARKADVQSVSDLLKQLSPQERSGAEAAIAEMAQTAQHGRINADGTYTPSTITPGTAEIGMPYTEAAPTGQARQDILMQTAAGGSPRAADLAKALMAQSKPEEFTIESTGRGLMRVGKTTGEASPVMYGGEVLMPRDAYSMGMTPQQKQQYDLDVLKFGVDEAQARLARAKAADEGIDVSGISIPGAMVAPTAAPQVGPPIRVPSVTPAEMRMGAEGVPTTVRTPTAATAPTRATPQAGPTTDVPLIKNPLLGGKQKRELLMLEPQARARASSTQSELQALVDMANDLKNHPGLPEITGKLGQYSVTDLSPLAREARGLYDALRTRTSLLKTAMVREASATGGAFGNMTEQEWPRLESAFGNISNAQDPNGLLESLDNYINNVNSMGVNNLGIYENTYGKLKWSPATYTPLSKKYQKGAAKGQRGQWGQATMVAD